MKYKTKPVEIEAIQFIYSTDGINELKTFCGESLGNISKARHIGAKGEAHILTLEDGKDNSVKHIATEGDYIIKGLKGEFYPIKPDIFHMKYELVPPTTN